MPNWIEGTMKLRGKREDILRFFREGVDASAPHKLEDQVKDESSDDSIWIRFTNEPHIKGTRRAFIESDYAEMYGDVGIVCVNIKQAWTFCSVEDLCVWKRISDTYNVDLKLYGIECGMEFTQEVIIIRGEEPKVNERRYEDWEWDCPFPRMGG